MVDDLVARRRHSGLVRPLKHLPKAHLHLHLDGAMRASTLRELAEATGTAAPMPTTYGSFAAFTATIAAAARVLRNESAVRRVVDELFEDAARQGAVWVEPSMWPGLFRGRLGPDVDAVDIVLDAGRVAGGTHGIGFGLILAANRERGPCEALHMARLAASRADAGVVGFGLDGDEAAHRPALFIEAFDVAREAGLMSVPHAGELAGPSSVSDALDLLGANRILHGVRAVESRELLDRLAATGTCLDVCPTSNVQLSVVSTLEEHPLPDLLAAGIRCSVNADDPLLFATDLLEEYQRCRDVLLLTDEQLAQIARASLEASAAPASLVRHALSSIDEWLRDERAPHEMAERRPS